MKDADGLTPKQAAFVREYLVDLNATQAAARVGYSKKTADVQGARLLGNVKVAKAIAAAKAKRATKVDISAEWVLKRLRKESIGKGVDTNPGARVTALGLIGKHLDMFKERVQHEGKDGGACQVQVLSYRGTKLEDLGE